MGDIENAVFDVKPLKVSMPEMISAGYFTIGETFYLKDATPGGALQGDGKLLQDGIISDMHSHAATVKKVKAGRLNGFDVWYVRRGEELVGIRTVREQYRQMKQKETPVHAG